MFSTKNFSREKLTILSTTSLVECGLFDVLIPLFEKRYNCSVKTVAVGTGQAIKMAQNGDGDLLFVHDKESEEKFVKEGYGVKRIEIMQSEFLIVGPENDPAKIKNKKVLEAFKNIYQSKSKFISRGDNSGTHKKELSIWKRLNINPVGSFYIETGCGMEMTLRIANQKNAYCLVDRATFISHKKEIDKLVVLVKNDPLLYNPYSVIVVSPLKFPWVNFKLAQKFVEFIKSEGTQKIIKNFGIKEFGQPLFSSISGKD